ncbi:unnamed protein product, partial [marine sediment metagenome]
KIKDFGYVYIVKLDWNIEELKMVNKNYRSGRNFEYRVKKYLEEKGYYVMRSAGSKSPFDLVAVSDVHLLLIQCKYGKAPSGETKKELITWKNKTIGIPTLVWAKRNNRLHISTPSLFNENWIWLHLMI